MSDFILHPPDVTIRSNQRHRRGIRRYRRGIRRYRRVAEKAVRDG